MYEAHFGLRQRPFRATPDQESYYPATSHEQALARLQQAVQEDEGLILLLGEPGTGKTLLCRQLLEQLGPDVTSAFLTNSHFRDCASFFQAILYDLSLPYEGLSEQEMRLKLTDFLLINFAESRRTVLVVDEAQHLTPELLEELRLWGNLESRQGRALQIILAAQSGFAETLRRPELAGFRQRLVIRITLKAFTRHEAADYLVHQLRAAGGKPERILSEEALEVLARGTQGVPRLLNQAAHQALTLACQAVANQVDAEIALEALNLLGLTYEEMQEEGELGTGLTVGEPAAGANGEEPAISEFSVEEGSQEEALPQSPEPAGEGLAAEDLNLPRQSA